MTLRRLVALLGALGAAGVLLGSCTSGSDAVDQGAGGEYRYVAATSRGQTIAAGRRKTAPDVRGSLVGGGQLDVDSLLGKVVVLNFWASWCAPCRVESPDFQRVYQATKARGVEFVGVAIRDDEQAAQAFLANKKITYPSLFDPNGTTILRFRDFPAANGMPYTIVLDKQARVAGVYLGALLGEDIEPVVTRLAAEP